MGYRAAPNKLVTKDGKPKYKNGVYNLINPKKYLGDPSLIWFRSGWEYKLYYYMDTEPRVLKWNVEGITIPYQMEEKGRWSTHSYHPDCYGEILGNDGVVRKVAIEIKPKNETEPPIMPKKITAKSLETHEYRLRTYLKNINKWKAAKEYCNKRGVEFFLLTEEYFKDKQIKLF